MLTMFLPPSMAEFHYQSSACVVQAQLPDPPGLKETLATPTALAPTCRH